MSDNNSLDLQAIHDLLMVSKPSEASHDASLCPLCVASDDGAEAHNDDDTLGGDVSTYTQDELNAAVAEAVADIQAKLDALTAEQGLAEFETRLSEMAEAHEAKVAELQAQIDAAMASAEAATKERDDLVALREAEQVAAEAAEALAARTEEIKAVVAGLFAEDYVTANLERWAGMEAEAFEALLVDWQAAAEAAKAPKADDKTDEKLNATASTAMQTSADADGGERSIAEIRQGLHTRGHDVRSVGASYTGVN